MAIERARGRIEMRRARNDELWCAARSIHKIIQPRKRRVVKDRQTGRQAGSRARRG